MTNKIIILTNIVVKMKSIDYNVHIKVKEKGEGMKNRLKELRARDGYNQTELAKKAGVSRQTISLIERDDFMPSILTAVRIARIFGEPVENIFIFEEDEL